MGKCSTHGEVKLGIMCKHIMDRTAVVDYKQDNDDGSFDVFCKNCADKFCTGGEPQDTNRELAAVCLTCMRSILSKPLVM